MLEQIRCCFFGTWDVFQPKMVDIIHHNEMVDIPTFIYHNETLPGDKLGSYSSHKLPLLFCLTIVFAERSTNESLAVPYSNGPHLTWRRWLQTCKPHAFVLYMNSIYWEQTPTNTNMHPVMSLQRSNLNMRYFKG